ncbi:MAG: hypothetical protein WCK67_06480 [bacterium]
MFLYEAEGKKVTIAFELPLENIKIGDFIKVYNNKNGIVAQIINVKTNETTTNSNYAEGLILKTLTNNQKWIEWQGNLPARNFQCQKVTSEELINNTISKNISETVNIGYLASDNQPCNINADKINQPFIILSDNNSTKKQTIKKLAQELSAKGVKCLLLDIKGDFSAYNNTLTAGKNFKLPLNSEGIQSLYEKTLNTIPAETKAVIEDVLMHVQEYADKSDLGFVPFASFKGVVENEYKNSKVHELVLLKNQLSKLEKQGIYGNTRREIHAFENAIEKENLITVDLSNLPELWHSEILNYLINTGIKQNKKFIIFIEAEDAFADSKLLDKLLSLRNKSSITPCISSSYQNKNLHKLISHAENIMFFAPQFPFNITNFKEQLELLNQESAVLYGSITAKTPIFVTMEHSNIFVEDIVEQAKPINNQADFSQFLSSATPYNYNKEHESVEEYLEEPVQQLFTEEPYQEQQVDYPSYEEPALPVFEEETFESDEVFEEFEEYSLNETKESQDLYEEITKETFEQQEEPQVEHEQEAEEEINPYELDDDFEELTEENLEIKETPIYEDSDHEIKSDVDTLYTGGRKTTIIQEQVDNIVTEEIPVYPVETEPSDVEIDFKEGENVNHDKYGTGTIKKIINYGNKKLLSIQFEGVGRRLLDPQLAIIRKA